MNRKEDYVNRGVRDSKVPPVKGAVTDRQDVIRRPETHSEKTTQAENSSMLDGWM